ncbi:lanthionine synthetase LanC family protein, partial [Streptomyces sp. NPDC001034]|uniref:lanthionine synthetase LanC family protein n=1 Tax=Streptomyces sp. NPDC001034 TaxID=3154375 RepID=UPI003327ED50
LRYAAVRPERSAAHAAAGRALLDGAVRQVRGAGADASWARGAAGVTAAASLLGAPHAARPAPAPADRPASAAALTEPPAATAALPARLRDAEVGPDLSLAQGALGTLEALAVLAERGDAQAAEALSLRTGQALAFVEAQGHRCATPDHVPSPGLLTGLSGIGYGLLRLAHPDTVPSVLLLGHPGRHGD